MKGPEVEGRLSSEEDKEGVNRGPVPGKPVEGYVDWDGGGLGFDGSARLLRYEGAAAISRTGNLTWLLLRIWGRREAWRGVIRKRREMTRGREERYMTLLMLARMAKCSKCNAIKAFRRDVRVRVEGYRISRAHM